MPTQRSETPKTKTPMYTSPLSQPFIAPFGGRNHRSNVIARRLEAGGRSYMGTRYMVSLSVLDGHRGALTTVTLHRERPLVLQPPPVAGYAGDLLAVEIGDCCEIN